VPYGMLSLVALGYLGLWVMFRRVVDLYACWTIDSTWSVVMWKMMPSCLL
jgi:hypothetical protein